MMFTFSESLPESPEAGLLRKKMIETQLQARGITDEQTIFAMGKIPRQLFGDFSTIEEAYADSPFPILCKQTISQPYIVALMTQALEIRKDDKILEIGTGSGYQTAILSELSGNVCSIERHSLLADKAKTVLNRLGYARVRLFTGDGSSGLPAEAPFDRIIITAAATDYPKEIVEQLSTDRGIIIFPVGKRRNNQELLKVIRYDTSHYERISLGDVRFVPLIRDED